MERPTLFHTMVEEASRQCEDKHDRARKEAEAILDKARRTSAERRRVALETARSELEAAAQQARRVAAIEAEKANWAAEHAVAKDILHRVQDELARLTDSDAFPAILEALLKELLPELHSGRVVMVPLPYVERCQAWIRDLRAEGVTVEGFPALRDGGVVQDPKRTFRITNTLSGRCAKLEHIARKLCTTRLFNEGAGHDPS